MNWMGQVGYLKGTGRSQTALLGLYPVVLVVRYQLNQHQTGLGAMGRPRAQEY